MDVRVFNPHARSNRAKELRAMHVCLAREREKKAV